MINELMSSVLRAAESVGADLQSNYPQGSDQARAGTGLINAVRAVAAALERSTTALDVSYHRNKVMSHLFVTGASLAQINAALATIPSLNDFAQPLRDAGDRSLEK